MNEIFPNHILQAKPVLKHNIYISATVTNFYDAMDEQEQIATMKSALKLYRLRNFCQKNKQPILNCDKIIVDLANALCLNYYDISRWQEQYLEIWSKNMEHPYILAGELFNDFDLSYSLIFKNFFQIYQDKVTINVFLQMICLIVFVSFDKLIRILLSVCGIQSNLNITYEQSLEFINSIIKEDDYDLIIIRWLLQHEDSQFIPCTEISFLFQSAPSLYNTIRAWKQKFVKNIITEEDYVVILKRIKIYYMANVNIMLKIPRENCCKYMRRKLITHKPDPNRSDYRIMRFCNNDISSCVYLDPIVTEIRKRYGYCRRHLLMTSSCYTSSSSEEISLPKDYMTKTVLNIDEKLKKNRIYCSEKYKRSITHATVYALNPSEPELQRTKTG